MTVENDGLPQAEPAVHEPYDANPGLIPDDEPLDAPNDMLPLDGATAKKIAATDAAARKAEMTAAPAPDAPPAPLPPAPPAQPPGPVSSTAAPPTTPLPIPAAAASPMAAEAVSEQATEMLPLDPRSGPRISGTATHGRVEGDLFDDRPS